MSKVIKQRVVETVDAAAWGEVPPVLQRIYAARGIHALADLERGLKSLLPYQELKDIDRACAVLAQAIQSEKRILIVGDFDADGATSTAVAVRALRMLGAAHVDYLVPNRFEFGYGLTPEIVDVAKTYSPDLIITVDNGIASHDGVARANALGIQVVITDHHLPAATLPEAEAIVNPNQHGDRFPSKNLAGVGVIFYMMLALRASLRDMDWFNAETRPEPNLAKLLDIVALGTVADLVPLDKNNRILVYQGLQRIRAWQGCPGIYALIMVSKRQARILTSGDLAYAVAPRLNAAGRLKDMALGIECLLTDDRVEARKIARQLDKLNRERQGIEADMHQQALKTLDSLVLNNTGQSLPSGMCLFDPRWHQGVVGILAARIKERFYRPTICFTLGEDNMIKGSARSIPGLHMRDVLDAIATRNPGLISKFGGHAMAAGLSLDRAHFETFKQAYLQEVSDCLSENDLSEIIYTDGVLQASEFSVSMAKSVRDGGPWGKSFPEPVFEGVFTVIERKLVAEKHLKLVLRPALGGMAVDSIAFNMDESALPLDANEIFIVYNLSINDFQGQRRLQLVIVHLEPQGQTIVQEEAEGVDLKEEVM